MKNFEEFVVFICDGLHGTFNVSGVTYVTCANPFTEDQVKEIDALGEKYKLKGDDADWEIYPEKGEFSFLVDRVMRYHRNKNGEVSKRYDHSLFVAFLEDLAKLNLPIVSIGGFLFDFSFSAHR
jgi:hypothetical protein